jgi:hypothetical protein
MNKLPFTQEGVNQLLQDLYSLPASELKDQSILVHYDFKNWVIDRFDFTSDQINFLYGLPEESVSFMASNASFAIANKLPIVLEKDDAPISLRGNKFIRPKSELSSSATDGGSFEAEGQLIIEIGY